MLGLSNTQSMQGKKLLNAGNKLTDKSLFQYVKSPDIRANKVSR